MAFNFDTGIFSAVGLDGDVLPGAQLFWYVSGTSTAATTYSDRALATSNANPVVASADGRFGPIWLADSDYKFILKDAAGVTLVTRDPVANPVYNTVRTVANRAAMAALSPSVVQVALIAGDESIWQWQAGDYSALVALDPLHGLYQPHATIPAATGCWVRKWDTVTGRPEWFGAIKGGSDCYAAITACMTLCPVTQLGEGDYFTSDTLRLPPYRTLEGVGGTYRAESGVGTRIVITSGTKDVIAMGLASYPGGGINSFARGSIARGFAVGRSLPVVPPPTLSPQIGACGVRMTFALHCRIEDVYAAEHSTGFYFNGVVRSYAVDCKAFRQIPGTTTTNDFFRGVWCDGGGSYGLSGGNGSLFVQDCNVSIGGTPNLSESVGYYLSNAFVDTILLQPEATATQFGIMIDGDNTTGSNDHIDLTITNPVLDSITGTGIRILETNAYAAIEINGGYIGLTGSTAFAGYHVTSPGVTIRGGLVWGEPAATSGANCFGLYAEGANRLRVTDLKATSCKRPFGLVSCADFVIDAAANNPSPAASQAAFDLTTCTIGQIFAQVTGGGYTAGINLVGTGNSRIEVNCTKINSAALTGGSGNKLLHNSTQITATGAFGTLCLAQGVMS